jgi:hypothetical protein
MHLVIDTETELIGAGRVVPRLACVSVCELSLEGEAQEPRLFGAGDPFPDFFRSWASRGGWLGGHNIAYDCAVICRAWPELAPLVWSLYREGRVWDSGLSERLKALALGWSVHPATGRGGVVSRGSSLADLARVWLGVDMSALKFDPSSPRFAYGRLVGVPVGEWSDEARRYALEDAHVTARVIAAQQAELKGLAARYDLPLDVSPSPGGELLSLASFGAQVRADFALMHLRAWGLRSSPAAVAKWRATLEARADELKARPLACGYLRESGSKNLAAVRAAVERAYGAAACPRTAKGEPSTSTDALAGAGEPALKALAELADVSKLLGTFGPVLEGAARGPLCPRWNVLVRSGRTSCTSPNLQQLPRKGGVRECFEPRAGCVYIGADYSTAELVALADICERWGLRSNMADQIRAGRDLHLALAADMLGLSYDEAARLKSEGDERVIEARQRAKIPNFGLPGGLGAHGLIEYARGSGQEINLDEARELKAAWFRAWPEMSGYFERVQVAVDSGRAVQEVSRRVRGAVGFTDGANTYFQGLIADGAKAALFAVVEAAFMRPESPLYGVRPVAFVHDEIICEAPAEIAPAAADELARVMVVEMGRFVRLPLGADAWVSRRWRKGLEGVRDEQGRLVILD